MKLTREQKILLAVVGLGAVAFFVDRVVIGSDQSGPQNAAASPVAVTAAVDTAPALSAPMSSVVKVLTQGPTIAQRLSQLAATRRRPVGADRDAFTPAQTWINTSQTSTGSSSIPQWQTQFKRDHQLMAVMASSDARIALVKTKVKGEAVDLPLSVGDQVNGFTLIAIEKRKACFESASGQVILEVE
jgi:hypothetical protein